MALNRLLMVLLLFTFNYYSFGERLKDLIYENINTSLACFRRLNATHQTGCTSPDAGSVGIINLITSIEDAKWMISSKSGPYIALVSTIYFEKSLLDVFLKSSQNVAGVLLFQNGTNRPDWLSGDSHCPNEFTSGPGSTCSGDGWNPHGSALLHRDIPFPIFYLLDNMDQVDFLVDCYNKFNSFDKENQGRRPLCAAELTSFMFAAVNTRVCMRRSRVQSSLVPINVCDPLGDRNIIYPLLPRTPPLKNESKQEVNEPEQSVYLVTARLDSTTLFDGISPGAASSVVGSVLLQTIAVALTKMIPNNFTGGNVIFALFNGEAYDYIGSSRMAYDMTLNEWPYIDKREIRMHIEIGQIGASISDSGWKLAAFAPNYNGTDKEEIEDFISTLSNYDTTLELIRIYTDNLPPSSIHSFRRVHGDSMRHLLLADHKDTFTNRYYHSVLDDVVNIKYKYKNITIGQDGTFVSTAQLISDGTMSEDDIQVKVARTASTIAKTLFTKLTGSLSQKEAASAHMVDELLYCYLSNSLCPIFQAASNKMSGTQRPQPAWSNYVSVYHSSQKPLTWSIRSALVLLAAKTYNSTNESDCLNNNITEYHTHYWMLGWNNTGVCIISTVNMTEAVSPAFLLNDYDWTSKMYSTWTESVWRSVGARVFIKASGAGSMLALILGIIVTLLTIFTSIHIKKKSYILFPESGLVPVSSRRIQVVC